MLQPTQEDEDLLAQSNFWERIELPPVKVRPSPLILQPASSRMQMRARVHAVSSGPLQAGIGNLAGKRHSAQG